MRRSVIKSSPFTTFVSSFSTTSGGGRGRGGGGRGFIIFTKEQQDAQHLPPPPPVIGSGPAVGRGRPIPVAYPLGKPPLQPDPIGKPPLQPDPFGKPPIFSTSAGRGKVPNPSAPPPPRVENRNIRAAEKPEGPPTFSNLDKGAGRGNVQNSSAPPLPRVENRDIRAAEKPEESAKPSERLSREEAVKKAIGILSRGGGGGGGSSPPLTRGGKGGAQGFRGGRGRGRGRGGRGRGDGAGRRPSEDDDYASGLYLGEAEDGEKLAKRLGPQVMNQLAEGFDEMAIRVLPSPLDDAYEDALRTNLMIECEPEYFIPDFASNPDIDDTPPMSLEEAFQKMKPFLMAYENIQSHQEWEEAIEETMKSVPLLKQIVDLYGGPDVVTAMQQQQELERVAKDIPQKGPASIRRFANNAVLSLQSNPGWGFDKKCQLMDKLVQEVSQHYK